uniref:Ig-like domain-containing protein n=1 Tax=Pseudonaja textilis TaxID=8673 RepID=A0A670Z2T1_PSETE
MLWAPWTLGSALTVTQTPSFVSDSTGQNISFECSVDNKDYHFYWYRQLPGKTQLEVLGSLFTYSAELEDIPSELKARLKGKGSKSDNSRKMSLDLFKLQANDTGLYLCAADSSGAEVVFSRFLPVYKGYFSSADPKCNDQPQPRVVLLSPLCHKKSINLVCLAQGFHYEWPLDVIWERDGQKINRLSSATEPIKKQGECNFATASRMRVLAEEWQQGHNYSCHVNQTGQVVSDSVKSSPDHKTGKEMLGS